MAFSDWTINKTNAQTSVALTVTSPLVGGSSLRIVRASGSGVTRANLHLTSAWPRGFTSGKVRTLWSRIAGGTSSDQHSGCLCMQDAFDLTAGSGSAYAMYIQGNGHLYIKKFSAGISSGGTVIDSLTYTPPSGINCWEFQWRADEAALGGTRLTVRHGVESDFSDLAVLLDVIDDSSPLLDSVAEGIYGADTGSGSSFEWYFDSTSIIQLP